MPLRRRARYIEENRAGCALEALVVISFVVDAGSSR